MKIEHYNFGSMTIDGQVFDKDLIITPKTILPNWWRQQGHKLQMEDLESIWESEPEILIIGTGKLGVMKVPTEVKARLEERLETLHIERTPQAVELYNQLSNSNRVVAAFHLTC